MRPFSSWYEAASWLNKHADGECSILTPGKIWRWSYCDWDMELVYSKPYSQRRIYP